MKKNTRKKRPAAEPADWVWEHIGELHAFVKTVGAYGTDPMNWPLDPVEKIQFCRVAIGGALELKKTEPWISAEVHLAARKLKT